MSHDQKRKKDKSRSRTKTNRRSASGALEPDIAGAGNESRSKALKTSQVPGSSSSFRV